AGRSEAARESFRELADRLIISLQCVNAGWRCNHLIRRTSAGYSSYFMSFLFAVGVVARRQTIEWLGAYLSK
ncbi:hypothetical protein ACQWHR_24920, partial [Salmonella enterica subsp. enterica serovar Infantis]